MVVDELAYKLIKDWMVLNEFVVSGVNKYAFIKGNVTVSIVPYDEEGNSTFRVDYMDGNAVYYFFTGNLILPVLLGYLLWHNLITEYKIS